MSNLRITFANWGNAKLFASSSVNILRDATPPSTPAQGLNSGRVNFLSGVVGNSALRQRLLQFGYTRLRYFDELQMNKRSSISLLLLPLSR